MKSVCIGCLKENFDINENDKGISKKVIDIKFNTGYFMVQRIKSLYNINEKIELQVKEHLVLYKKIREQEKIIYALKEISKESMNVNEENEEEIRYEIEVL